jgi:hypothetical protein
MKRLLSIIALMILAIPCTFSNVSSEEKHASSETRIRNIARDEVAIERWEKRIKGIINAGMLPIIDTEATYGREINISRFIKFMDDLGVELVAFAPKFKDPSKGSIESLELYTKYPGYFVPTTTDATTEYWFRQSGPFIDKAEEEVRSGEYYFMGEYELRHYMSPRQYKRGETWRDVSISPDFPWMHRIFKISSEAQITFQIHHEPEDN